MPLPNPMTGLISKVQYKHKKYKLKIRLQNKGTKTKTKKKQIKTGGNKRIKANIAHMEITGIVEYLY